MIYEAKASAGIVSILQDGIYTVASDIICMSAGDGNSNGIVVLDEHGGRYFTNTQLDLAWLISEVSALVKSVKAITDATYVTGATGAVITTKPEFLALSANLDVIDTELNSRLLK